MLDQAEVYHGMGHPGALGVVGLAFQHAGDLPSERLCHLYALAIDTLGRFMRYAGGNQNLPGAPQFGEPYDVVAARSHAYVIRNCANQPERVFQANIGLALYNSATNRTGLGLRYVIEAVNQSQANSWERMVAEGALADLQHDAGEFESRDWHRSNAVKAGLAFFRFDPSRGDGAAQISRRLTTLYNLEHKDDEPFHMFRVIAWNQILMRRIQDLSEVPRPRVDELRRTWALLRLTSEADMNQALGHVLATYPRVIRAFARVGDTTTARGIKEEMYAKAHYKNNRVEFIGAEAAIAAAEGDHVNAADLWLRWAKREHPIQAHGANAVERDGFGRVGIALERAGRFDEAIEYLHKAIESYETNRSSYGVASRKRFLRGNTIRAYWALTRAYASKQDVANALRSARRLTARQFGDQLGVESARRVDTTTLRLLDTDVLIKYVETDSSLVAFTMTTHESRVHLIPFDRGHFRSLTQRLRAALRKRGADYAGAASGVARVVIGHAVAELIRGARRLIVISDGELATVPFGALSLDETYRPLVADVSVQVAPSLDFLAAKAAAPTDTRAAKFFVLANPTYGKSRGPSRFGTAAEVYQRAIDALGLFTPLPETEDEARALSETFGDDAVTTIARRDAVESRIKSTDLAAYTHLHFATHGVLGNQIPGVSEPALVMGFEPNEDGFLTMSEVQDLRLTTRLTVLSACDTGTGEYYDGEGVMGLGRAFLLAGSDAVIATFWPIASRETVRFMTAFYKRLEAGAATDRALRETQLQFLRSGRATDGEERGLEFVRKSTVADTKLAHPYYWAPFVLIGSL